MLGLKLVTSLESSLLPPIHVLLMRERRFGGVLSVAAVAPLELALWETLSNMIPLRHTTRALRHLPWLARRRRCGMVYVDPKNLGYRPYIWTWCNSRPTENEAEIMRSLMEKYVQPCVDFVLEGIEDDQITKRLKQAVPHTNLNMVTQLCNLLQTLLQEEKKIQDPQVGRGL